MASSLPMARRQLASIGPSTRAPSNLSHGASAPPRLLAAPFTAPHRSIGTQRHHRPVIITSAWGSGSSWQQLPQALDAILGGGSSAQEDQHSSPHLARGRDELLQGAAAMEGASSDDDAANIAAASGDEQAPEDWMQQLDDGLDRLMAESEEDEADWAAVQQAAPAGEPVMPQYYMEQPAAGYEAGFSDADAMMYGTYGETPVAAPGALLAMSYDAQPPALAYPSAADGPAIFLAGNASTPPPQPPPSDTWQAPWPQPSHLEAADSASNDFNDPEGTIVWLQQRYADELLRAQHWKRVAREQAERADKLQSGLASMSLSYQRLSAELQSERLAHLATKSKQASMTLRMMNCSADLAAGQEEGGLDKGVVASRGAAAAPVTGSQGGDGVAYGGSGGVGEGMVPSVEGGGNEGREGRAMESGRQEGVDVRSGSSRWREAAMRAMSKANAIAAARQ